ncbi:putative tubulin--tyrosine ligase pby1 [Thecaphora frezii]|nr:putative tubulin-tyrosine ligase [Thecaphora frezii]
MSTTLAQRTAYVSFPGADYTHHAALSAARAVLEPKGWSVIDGASSSSSSFTSSSSSSSSPPSDSDSASTLPPNQSLYLADYDLLPFETLLPRPSSPSSASASQCSSYVIRKALIRKHYLASALHTYSVKHADADRYRRFTPQTWALDVQFADELDELLMDDLYDLNQILEHNEEVEDKGEVRWFILKPGMADRGNGIRLFSTVDQLRTIFEEFEPESDDEEEEDEEEGDGEEDQDEEEGEEKVEQERKYAGKDTSVMASQLRHFVIQEYLSNPLLLNPSLQHPDVLSSTLSHLSLTSPFSSPSYRKFHLRAYVLCAGSLSVYLHDTMLALFAPLPYSAPTDATMTDLRPHLTNTCLQPDGSLAIGDAGRPKEENVYLWQDLVGAKMPNGDGLREETVQEVKKKAVEVVGSTFEACAKAGAVHWQMWPNAFEIFGVDLLVQTVEGGVDVQLLEVNAQPDFAQTGSRLSATIDRLFERTCQVAVLPFHNDPEATAAVQDWKVGESREGTTLCFREELNKGW